MGVYDTQFPRNYAISIMHMYALNLSKTNILHLKFFKMMFLFVQTDFTRSKKMAKYAINNMLNYAFICKDKIC